jgi:hypothetical protein
LQQEADAEGVTGFRGEELLEAVLRDLDTAPLSEKEKELLRFVDKVNHHSPEITAADMQPLYGAGWTDEAIYYAITIRKRRRSHHPAVIEVEQCADCFVLPGTLPGEFAPWVHPAFGKN